MICAHETSNLVLLPHTRIPPPPKRHTTHTCRTPHISTSPGTRVCPPALRSCHGGHGERQCQSNQATSGASKRACECCIFKYPFFPKIFKYLNYAPRVRLSPKTSVPLEYRAREENRALSQHGRMLIASYVFRMKHLLLRTMEEENERGAKEKVGVEGLRAHLQVPSPSTPCPIYKGISIATSHRFRVYSSHRWLLYAIHANTMFQPGDAGVLTTVAKRFLGHYQVLFHLSTDSPYPI
jgi:hypothetical protein